MRNKKLVILGAGGHAKVCFDVAQAMKQWEEILILDDNPVNDYFKIEGTFDSINDYPEADFFVAIGSNNFRSKMLKKLETNNFKIATLIHPTAVVGGDVQVGVGTVLMASSVINSSTRIGKGAIINTAASVDHDNVIGECVHLSPGARTAGTVEIGDYTWIGIGSVISNNVKVGSGVTVGAGGTVLKDIKKQGTYIGTPAKLITR